MMSNSDLKPVNCSTKQKAQIRATIEALQSRIHDLYVIWDYNTRGTWTPIPGLDAVNLPSGVVPTTMVDERGRYFIGVCANRGSRAHEPFFYVAVMVCAKDGREIEPRGRDVFDALTAAFEEFIRKPKPRKDKAHNS